MASKYWVGGGSSTNWNAITPTNWSLTDGGANNAAVPVAGDDVFMKSNADCNINVNTANLRSFDMTGYTGTFATTNKVINVIGGASGQTTDVKMGVSTPWYGTLLLKPGANRTINLTTNSNSVHDLELNGAGKVVLQDDLLLETTLDIVKGTFDSNEKTLNIFFFHCSSSSVIVIDITNSTINLNWSDSRWYLYDESAVTLYASGSEIIFTAATSSAFFMSGAVSSVGLTYGKLTIVGVGSLATITPVGTTFSDFEVTAGQTVELQVGETMTVTGSITMIGSSGSPIVLSSRTLGAQATISCPSGTVLCDYLTVSDSIAAGGVTFYAGDNSTNAGNNYGWVFYATPTTFFPKAILI